MKLINPKFNFLQLNDTIGRPSSWTKFEWYEADLAELFGLTELTSQSIYDFALKIQSDFTVAKDWARVKRGFPVYGDLSLQGDVDIWGFAPTGTTADEIFTSLDTGLLAMFCLMTHSMYENEVVACYD